MCGNNNQSSFLILLLLSNVIILIQSDNSAKKINVTNYYQFLDKTIAHLPKCCPINTSLQQINNTIECVLIKENLRNFQIFSTRISQEQLDNFEICANAEECIDYLKIKDEEEEKYQLARIKNCQISEILNSEEILQFPKCCPFDHSYNPKNHNCIFENKNGVLSFNEIDVNNKNNQTLQVIKLSLSSSVCLNVDYAIVDFQEEFTIENNGQVRNVRLSNGRNVNNLEYGNYCIDKNAIDGKPIIKGCIPYDKACIRLGKRCVKKCCPDGQMYAVRNKRIGCEFNFTAVFNLSNDSRFNSSDKEYGILFPGKVEKYSAGSKYQFYIDESGFFHSLDNGVWITKNPKDALYCVENTLFLGKVSQNIYLLYNVNHFETIKFYAQGTILSLSCVLLFVTIICYLILPEMQNVHGRAMLMFCIFMLTGCLTLCFMQLYQSFSQLPDWICLFLGITIIFAFLGSFAWMNVICFDMWMAFGTMRVVDFRNKQKDAKKFLYYNFYAWSVPITICGLAFFVYQTECLPSEFTPQLDWYKCYFKKQGHSYDYLIFFIIPEATMILVNIILFVKTSVYCYKVKNEIHQMRNVTDNRDSKKQRFQADKEKFIMLLKLFLVMGISWSLEAIFSVFSSQNNFTLQVMELIGDCINAAEGIIIFCIFLMKKKVLTSIKTRLGLRPKRKVSEFSSVFTGVSGANVGLYSIFVLCHTYASTKNQSK